MIIIQVWRQCWEDIKQEAWCLLNWETYIEFLTLRDLLNERPLKTTGIPEVFINPLYDCSLWTATEARMPGKDT